MAAKDIEAARAHVLITIRDRMTQGLKVAEQKLQNFGRYVATSAGVVTAGIGAGLAWPLKLAANMEQTQVSFEVMLGSADKAKKMLKDLEQMGADTPFTFDQLKDAGQTLLNFNVSGNVLLPTLRAIGDVSAGNAERFSRLALAYGQTTAKGRLMGQEVNQMVEAGFNPLNEISRTTGRSMRELNDAMEKGEISAAMLQNAFVTASGAGGKFNGMMEKQSKTLIGLLSTLFDNAAMVARAFGDTLVPAIKRSLTVGIALSKFITKWIADNKELVGIIASVAAGIFIATSAIFALGVASMSASFFMGIMASGFAAITSVVGFLFSPLGALVGVLVGLGVAAYAFRGSIAASFGGLIAYFGPVFDTILQLKDLFMGAFNAIVDALADGRIETAGNIAWNALLAMTFTATSGLIDIVVAMLGTVGQAIMSGNWNLAAAIAMLKMQMAIVGVWNEITSLWDAAVMGIGMIWDRIIYAIPESFRKAGFQIAETITWLIGKFGQLIGMKDNFMLGLSEEIGRMNKQQSGDAAREQQKRDQTRMGIFNQREASRGNGLAGMNQQLNELNAKAAAGYAAAGNPTGESIAAEARKKLDYSIAAAEEEKKKLQAKGNQAAGGAQAASNAVDATGKKATAGTFSAFGAALLGTSRGDAANVTAKNTTRMVQIMTKPTGKQQPGLAP